MQTVIYDGSLDGFLCAVFDVYEYRFEDVEIVPEHRYGGALFGTVHRAVMQAGHSERVWKGLKKKLTAEGLEAFKRAFLSEAPGMETTLLQYARYLFSSPVMMENDFSHPAVLSVVQTARKVWREKHRMEAFVRFRKGSDGIYFAVVEPDHNVLPLIAAHFRDRYADQQWVIWDARRKYGIHYDGQAVREVALDEAPAPSGGPGLVVEEDSTWQDLWQQYFNSVNIAARKNRKLHLQHMPQRYWKYLPEKRPARFTS